tara:strand:- start:53 stop:391 length:339 start_codon:yes stop_codon:yes gene_type:complete
MVDHQQTAVQHRPVKVVVDHTDRGNMTLYVRFFLEITGIARIGPILCLRADIFAKSVKKRDFVLPIFKHRPRTGHAVETHPIRSQPRADHYKHRCCCAVPVPDIAQGRCDVR